MIPKTLQVSLQPACRVVNNGQTLAYLSMLLMLENIFVA